MSSIVGSGGFSVLRVLDVLKQEGFECLPCERVNLDSQHFAEYRDSDEHPAEAIFEYPVPEESRKKVSEIESNIPTILHYFLDGSRRTYKVADIILQGRYLPIVAGQVGVAVMQRCTGNYGLKPMRELCRIENVIAFPDRVNKDDLVRLEGKVNSIGNSLFFKVLRYEVKAERDPVDLGVARIMSHMHDLEISCVETMANNHLLANNRLLVIDGPLRFKKKFDIVQFRNVIGLSKTFRPSFTVGKGRKRADVGAITCGLAFGERTVAFKTLEGDKTIGMWYLRTRKPELMLNPLQGIVKIECFAVGEEEKESGLDANRIDVISAHLLRERNVTPYKTDLRWASHIYPIYLAETYLKASFMSDVRFTALF